MARKETRRACRHRVDWPARIRGVADAAWMTGRVINLSVSGVLLLTGHHYSIGDRVEVEIDFMTEPDSKTVVFGVGNVVRDLGSRGAAIHFDTGCAPRRTEG